MDIVTLRGTDEEFCVIATGEASLKTLDFIENPEEEAQSVTPCIVLDREDKGLYVGLMRDGQLLMLGGQVRPCHLFQTYRAFQLLHDAETVSPSSIEAAHDVCGWEQVPLSMDEAELDNASRLLEQMFGTSEAYEPFIDRAQFARPTEPELAAMLRILREEEADLADIAPDETAAQVLQKYPLVVRLADNTDADNGFVTLLAEGVPSQKTILDGTYTPSLSTRPALLEVTPCLTIAAPNDDGLLMVGFRNPDGELVLSLGPHTRNLGQAWSLLKFIEQLPQIDDGILGAAAYMILDGSSELTSEETLAACFVDQAAYETARDAAMAAKPSAEERAAIVRLIGYVKNGPMYFDDITEAELGNFTLKALSRPQNSRRLAPVAG